MTDNLTAEQLSALLDSVFALQPRERWLALLVDLPDAQAPDSDAWAERRRLAADWFRLLHLRRERLPFTAIAFCAYPNVGSNNGDLPESAAVAFDPDEQAALPAGQVLPFATILQSASVVLAPTQFSATAPLKVLARQHGFRGATLPGFTRAMIPALGLDYERVNARVLQFKERMDRAAGVEVALEADGRRYASFFDLRHRTGHASGGLIREPGSVGNLPSGEAYVVPYEGERPGDPSGTAGELPVQFGDEIVVYRLERNQAVEVLSAGPASEAERRLLQEEPAYGNLAEVGIGVLGEWGVQAVGSTLLDEKLGLHLAFGRSDHFGGVTGPAAFRPRPRGPHRPRLRAVRAAAGARGRGRLRLPGRRARDDHPRRRVRGVAQRHAKSCRWRRPRTRRNPGVRSRCGSYRVKSSGETASCGKARRSFASEVTSGTASSCARWTNSQSYALHPDCSARRRTGADSMAYSRPASSVSASSMKTNASASDSACCRR